MNALSLCQRSAEGLHRHVGDEGLRLALMAARDLPVPIPVLGTPYAIGGDLVLPRMAGGVGFADIAAVIAARGEGRLQRIDFSFPSSAAGWWDSQWVHGASVIPATGAAPAALPGGTVPDRTTVGALGQDDVPAGLTQHLSGMNVHGAWPQMLVLYDRLWHGAPVMNSAVAQTITGVPTRYTGAEAKGNVAWVEIKTALPATAHNVTVAYVDQDGNAAETAPTFAGTASGLGGRVSPSSPAIPLNGGDTGVRNLTSFTLSIALASGVYYLVVARPLAMVIASGVDTNMAADQIISNFNMGEIKNGACLSCVRYASTATPVVGKIFTVAA